ncbi:MAG: TIGR00730 family Rossman fold protein [Alphaproteobacteria bacterium]|nr:TIGR00730 family Rossman fold protein [Alphaproteobacteria bacterium]
MPRHMPDKAFKNPDFVNSRDGRVMRIMAEYLEPQKRLRDAGIEDTIVFFGSARTPALDDATGALAALRETPDTPPEVIARAERGVEMAKYYEAARELSYKLTEWAAELARAQGDSGHRFSVVTGGGPGIMEAANRGAAEAGGSTIGMNISLPFEQYPNEYISDGLAFEFHYFFMRKFWLVYLAKAAVVMPGGFGTLDEFMEVLTLVQTEKIRRDLPIILFGSEYWRNIVEFEPMAEFGTIDLTDLDLFHITDSVDDAFEWLKDQLSGWAVDNPGAGLTTDVEIVGKPDR